MNEELTARMHQRAQSLYRYITAMESGNTALVIAVLQEAEHDQVLERMILETNATYQDGDQTVVRPDEVIPVYAPLSFVNPPLEAATESKGTNALLHPVRPSSRKHRLSALVQTLVAVMVVVALIAGFLALFASRHISRLGGSPPLSRVTGTWRIVKSPNPGAYANNFFGVTAVSASDVWVVGQASPPDQTFYHTNLRTDMQSSLGLHSTPRMLRMMLLNANLYQTLIEHWNGSQWQQVPSPDSTHNELLAVTAISVNDIWAVGTRAIGITTSQTLIEHWNGSQWSMMPSPNPTETESYSLNALSARSANDIWAVGLAFHGKRTLIEHWNGSQWSVVPSPSLGGFYNQLQGVTAISANDVWAVGYASTIPGTAGQALIEHWNGSQWSIVKDASPATAQSSLMGITAVSANDVWAAGYLAHGKTAEQALIEHWNGSQWSVIRSPSLASVVRLYQMVTVSANDIWVVGQFVTTRNNQTAAVSLIEHWNGSQWSIVKSPSPGSASNSLIALAKVPSSNAIWGVGGYTTPNYYGSFKTLAELYS